MKTTARTITDKAEVEFFPIQLDPPKEITDKNELLGWCIRRLRTMINEEEGFT
jgi:hypothetical protein